VKDFPLAKPEGGCSSYFHIILRLGLPCFVLGILLCSCSNTKFIAKNSSLLVGNDVELKGDVLVSDKETLKENLQSPDIILQQPNYKTARIARVGLYLYNHYDSSSRTNKWWSWAINHTWIKPPVLYDSVKMAGTLKNMVAYLANEGFFRASAKSIIITKKQKTSVTYQINTGKNFLIGKISYDIPDTTIRKLVQQSADQAFIQPNMPYTADLLVSERDRLTELIRNHGYYRFSNYFVVFELDTINRSSFETSVDPFANIVNIYNAGRARERPILDITVEIPPEGDSTVFHQYTLDSIFVYPDFTIEGNVHDTAYKQHDLKDISIRYRQELFKPKVISDKVTLKKGSLYSQQAYNSTINSLNSLGEWKFVSIEYDSVPGNPYAMNSYVLLVPAKKQGFGVDLESSTSADYVLGTGLDFTYQNKNVDKSANFLNLALKGGLEFNSDTARPFYIQAQDFSGNLSLNIPRFMVPWKITDSSRFAGAKTTVGVGANYLDRLGYFRMDNFLGSFGYAWKQSKYKTWIVKPFLLDYTRYSNFSDSFQLQLKYNPLLAKSFESAFTEGEEVSFIFNNQDLSHPKKYDYFRVTADESGLLLQGLDIALEGVTGGKTNFGKLTSLNYSQYIRVETEFKHYYNRPHSTLVSRIFAGIGIPVGQSSVLPYIEQYFAGGPNSMRAWRLRALGPGSFQDTIPLDQIFTDQTADMKLEGNLEFRFDIVNFFNVAMLRGALFTDVGNIWDINPDPARPGGLFTFSTFYQDLAVGAGAGLRLDFSYFLLRFDFATALKQPYVHKNDGWIFKTIKPLDGYWRKDNLVFNFAIGYPF